MVHACMRLLVTTEPTIQASPTHTFSGAAALHPHAMRGGHLWIVLERDSSPRPTLATNC